MNTLKTHVSKPAAAFTRIVVAMALLSGLALVSPPAEAQSSAAPRAEIVKQLGDAYAEAPVAIGLTGNGSVIELFTTGDGSTWTIVITSPDGLSRVVAAGESWMSTRALAGMKV